MRKLAARPDVANRKDCAVVGTFPAKEVDVPVNVVVFIVPVAPLVTVGNTCVPSVTYAAWRPC
jgi:hypothetical protein